jgi:hypothetical protein
MPIIEIFIAAGYLIILILCFAIPFHCNSTIPSDQIFYHRIIPVSIALILLIMIIIRIFNINDFITNESRLIAKYDGWYEDRHTFQLLFVCSLIISGILVIIYVERKLSAIWHQYSWSIYSTIVLIGFITINAVSYHPIDQFLKHEIGGIKISRIIEFINIIWIIISLLIRYRHINDKMNEIKIIPGSRYI